MDGGAVWRSCLPWTHEQASSCPDTDRDRAPAGDLGRGTVMTYCHVVDVPAPIEVYDATHAELLRRTGGRVEGLLVHLCRPTEDGFQVVEIWSSRDACEQAERDLVGPALASSAGPSAGDVPAPRIQEFALRGLVIPAGGTVI